MLRFFSDPLQALVGSSVNKNPSRSKQSHYSISLKSRNLEWCCTLVSAKEAAVGAVTFLFSQGQGAEPPQWTPWGAANSDGNRRDGSQLQRGPECRQCKGRWARQAGNMAS